MFGHGQCAEGALRNLGSTAAAAKLALKRYGEYTGHGATVIQTVLAAEDLFGQRKELLAGRRTAGLTARDTSSWAGVWLFFVEGHIMAGGNGRLLNQCGHGDSHVVVALRVG